MLTRKLHEIRTIFDQYTQDTNDKRILELEAKYGYYSGTRFNSNVPYIHYERLLTRLREDSVETIEESQVAQSKDVRRITITNQGDGAETIIWQRKSRIRDIELAEYDIRISANIEEELDEIPNNFVAAVIRDRTRHTFILVEGLVKVDLTEVLMRSEDNIIRPRYEVEVEYFGPSNNLDIFAEQVEYIFKLLRGTNLVYTNTVKNQLITDAINILGGTRDNMIDKQVLVETRNIKQRDLVYGGIVGNQRIDDNKVLATPKRPGKEGLGTSYMITFKADGLRKMLIIHKTGIWLVYPPFEFNLALDTTLNVPQLDRLLNAMNGTILDGELVIPRTPKNTTYWYLAFDCLAFRGNAGIQRQPYTERQKVALAIANAVKTPIITVDTKETAELKTPSDFFRLVGEFLDKRDHLEYDEDGLIFVPIDTHYNPMSQRYPLHERSLTRIPDVCKWKEGADITIDFMLRWLPNGVLELHSYDEDKRETVPFKGDMINPLTSDMIDHTNPLTLNERSGLVVEYEWIKLDNGKGIFRPRKLRPEKSGPNRLAIALDDWEDIMNPITEEDIRGESLSMVFSYHNRIKRGLYNILTQNPDYNPKVRGSKRYLGANILDIGSGRGGDVAKWRRLSADENTGFVVAVEPNDSNREELVNRIETFSMQDKVRILATGGEDTISITEAVREHIPGGKVDAVTLMLSMSFFWASDSHLEALVQTIVNNLKPGGKIIFLTIDGDTVEQLFEPALGGQHITDLTIASANLHLYPSPVDVNYGRALDFVLPNTIVGEQREYLVHLQDFTLRLAKYGINLYEVHRAEGERLLSKSNELFSSLYSFGYYHNNDETALQLDDTVTNIILPIIPSPTKDQYTQMTTPQIPIPSPQVPSPQIPIPSPQVPTPQIPTPQVPTPQIPIPSPQVSTPQIPIPSPQVPSPQIPIPSPQVQIPQINIPLIEMPTLPTIVSKPSKFQIEHNQLAWLPVSYTNRAGNIVAGPAMNDDTYAPLRCTWYDDLIRIATIGDGSCFIHAVLKAFYRPYQENNDAPYRLELAAKIRRDLAVALGLDNPQYPGYTYWATSGRGAFPRMVMQEINDEQLVGELGVDFSLSGLQRLFNSTNQLGDEVYSFAADALNVDIYVLRATNEDLFPHYHTRRPNIPRNGIVIIGNMYHYEVLGINTEDGIQTVFQEGDPFLTALTQLFIGDGDFNDIVNTIPYNPNETFVRDFVDTFTTEEGLNMPGNLDEIFSDNDPFMIMVNQLMPQIEEMAEQRRIMLATPAAPRTDHPTLIKLDRILRVLEEAGYTTDDTERIREVIEMKINHDIDQNLDHVVASAETDGLITHDTAESILNVEATL